MIIVAHLHSFYDWQPVPADAEVTQADIDSRKVKPSSNVKADGSPVYLMRVVKKGETHTQVQMPEEQIIKLMIGDAIRDGSYHSRSQAVAVYMTRLVMPNHAHPRHIVRFEVASDPPDADLFRKVIAPHIAVGHFTQEDADQLEELYMTPAVAEDHARHLHKHFRVPATKNEVTP